MYRTGPGMFHEEPAEPEPTAEGVVGIVADDYEQAMAYVQSAPMRTPYVVILAPADIGGRRLAGLAILTASPLSEEMQAALVAATVEGA